MHVNMQHINVVGVLRQHFDLFVCLLIYLNRKETKGKNIKNTRALMNGNFIPIEDKYHMVIKKNKKCQASFIIRAMNQRKRNT